MTCRVEVYVNGHRMLCDPVEGEVRLDTRQVLQHRDLRLELLSKSGRTKLRQVSVESVEI